MTQFHFAWVDETETTFSAGTHARMDEDVFSLEISQTEGEFAQATVEVRTPATGLLNPARKLYAWISVTNAGVTTPLFFGRQNGFPKSLGSATVQLELVAQFPGWEADRDALFTSLKVSPLWDEAFIGAARLTDPQMALESRPALYHYHRTTGAVSLSDIITGGSSVTLTPYQDPPVVDLKSAARRCKIVASVDWEQRIVGSSFRANKEINFAFSAGRLNSFTPEVVEAGWPSVGDQLGGQTGYEVLISRIDRLNDLATDKDVNSTTFFAKVPPDQAAIIKASTGRAIDRYPTQIERVWFETSLAIGYTFRQRRTETLTVTVENDVQALAWGPTDQVDINLTFQAEDVVGLGFLDAKNQSWFLSPRGEQSFCYLMAIAKAHLSAAARAIEITFHTDFWDTLSLSCDHQVTISHPQLPGGTATGKVVSYTLRRVGDSGELSAEVKIGVSVGNGNAFSPSGVDDDYVGEDTLGGETQLQTGEKSGGTGLTDMIYNSYNDQLPTSSTAESHAAWGTIVESVSVENPPEEQQQAMITNQYPARDNISAVLKALPTKITLQLHQLSASDTIDHQITVVMAHPFAAPQGINLAA